MFVGVLLYISRDGQLTQLKSRVKEADNVRVCTKVPPPGVLSLV